jgi:hypothetical protein
MAHAPRLLLTAPKGQNPRIIEEESFSAAAQNAAFHDERIAAG